MSEEGGVAVPEIHPTTGDGRELALLRGVEAVDGGLVVALPTDTVYGLAVNAFDRAATARLFELTGRDRGAPPAVMVRSPKQLLGLTPEVPEAADALMAAFWPGPLTLILPAAPGLAWDLGRSDGVVGVRMPLDDVALDVVRAVGPLAVTGANRAGETPATRIDEVVERFGDDVACYLDDGPRVDRTRSTIVDLTRAVPHVLRAGPVADEVVLAVARGELDPLDAAAALEPPGEVDEG